MHPSVYSFLTFKYNTLMLSPSTLRYLLVSGHDRPRLTTTHESTMSGLLQQWSFSRRTLRRIFGEEGVWGTSASSKVVTSWRLVTAMIFSAATFRRPLAQWAASFGSPSLNSRDRKDTSICRTDTLDLFDNSAGVISISILRWLGSRHFEKEWSTVA